MANRKLSIRGDFDFIVPNVIVPSFTRGEDAKTLYDEVSKTIKNGVWYDKVSKTMMGSSLVLAAKVDSLVRPFGIRVATLADLSRPEIMEMTRKRNYSDTPTIAFITMKDSYEPNRILIKKLAPMVEEKAGKLRLPVLVTGFDVVSSEDKGGYGLDFVPRKDFAVLHDERLSGRYDGKKFSTVDENGVPDFESDGTRTWHVRNKGLSRLFLGWDLSLGPGYYFLTASRLVDLAESEDKGRIVLVRDAFASSKSARAQNSGKRIRYYTPGERVHMRRTLKSLEEIGLESPLIKAMINSNF